MLDFLPDYGGLPIVVGSVTPASPAEEVGFKEGDRLLKVGDEVTLTRRQLESLSDRFEMVS